MFLDHEWLQKRGGLNDAKILRIEQTAHGVVLVVEDEWANFAGLPEYSGPSEVKLVLAGGRIRGETPSNLATEFIYDVRLDQTGSEATLALTWYGQVTLVVWAPAGNVLVLRSIG